MTVNGYAQQERWILVAYMLMALSLFVGLSMLASYWISHQLLANPLEVWIRSHTLWIMRTGIVFLTLALLAALFALPLFWLPLTSVYGMICAGIAAGFAVIAWLWLLFRTLHGIRRYMGGKAVY